MTALATMLIASVAATANAQLNEFCTVSVLNRTAQVRGDGSWVLGNVPSNMGLVRARATCIENGVTRVGQSDYFMVPTNGVVTVAQIEFQRIEPVPAKLSLTAPRSTLAQVGDTVQLTATATQPDGGNIDVTSRGTNFTTSNPAVATVSGTGLVTARASGVVIITALNEGALALLRLGVGGVLDSDNDGMPDDYELANGLNPNNPADAAADTDGDRLTNLDEFRRGTNPRLVDTDGDGVGDGLEVETGSDPLDPRSVNLAQLLRSISVSPSPLAIVMNTLLSEASRLVQVTGTLTDGSTVNLTSRGRGTTYTSSNLAVASFGTTDGQIFAGTSGTATITIANNGFTTTLPVTVSNFSPTALAALPIPGFANNVDVVGNFAYVAAGAAGLQIVDVSDRAAPRIIGSVPTRGNANDVRVTGRYAYVADGAAGLLIVDASVPSQPVVVGVLDTNGTAFDVMLAGTVAFLADGPGGVAIIDVSNPALPRLVSTRALGGIVRSVTVLGSGVVVAGTETGAVSAIDVAALDRPIILSTVQVNELRDLSARGEIVYAAAYTSSLRLYDFSQPRQPVLRGTTSTQNGGILNDVETKGRFAFGADIFFVNGVPIIDISNPAQPVPRGRLDFPQRDDNGTGIAVDQQYVYLTAERGATLKPGVSGDTMLYIGRYLSIDDRAGIGPSPLITAPAAGSSVVEGAAVTVTVEATDDVAVATVELLIDDQPFGVVEAPPYRFAVPLPAGRASVTLQARARDYAGNAGISPTVRVMFSSDTLHPTAAITSPAAGTRFINGKTAQATVQASDNARVARVDLLIDGVVAGSTTVAPYRIDFAAPATGTSAVLTARAVDVAGNATVSAPVSIVLYRDDPPLVRLDRPVSGTRFFSGAAVRVEGVAYDFDGSVGPTDLLENGRIIQTSSYRVSNPGFKYYTPAGTDSVTLALAATDNSGQRTVSAPAELPLTQTYALGSTSIPGYANGVDVNDSHAFIAAGEAGLQVADVSSDQRPRIVAAMDTPGNANNLVVVGRTAFVADGAGGLQIIDVSFPTSPRLLSHAATDGEAFAVAVAGSRAYVTTPYGAEIFDVRSLERPRLVSRLRTEFAAGAVAAEGNHLVILTDAPSTVGFHGHDRMFLVVVDVGNPAAPVIFGSAHLNWGNVMRAGIALRDGLAYVAADMGIVAVRYTDTAALGQFYGGPACDWEECVGLTAPRLSGDLVLTAQNGDGGALHVQSNPFRRRVPFFTRSRLWAPDSTGAIIFDQQGSTSGTGLAVTPERAYMTGCDPFVNCRSYKGIGGNLTRLHVGRYLTRVDTAGAPPTVTLQAPKPALYERESMVLTAVAADDIAVKSVSFSVDGVVVFTDTAAPFQFDYKAPVGTSQSTIAASALDYGGHTASSASITLSIVRDVTPPAVSIDRPAGETVPGPAVTIHLSVMDDFAVRNVEFLVNGQVVHATSAFPYEYEYVVPAGMINLRVGAQAVDPAGNVGTATERLVEVQAPLALGSVAIDGFANRIAVNGRYAYVAAGAGGLQIVDIGNPATPSVVRTLATSGNANDVRIIGNFVYVAEGSPSPAVSVVDITNPPSAMVVGRAPTASATELWDLAVTGAVAFNANKTFLSTFAYGTNGTSQLLIFDVSTPAMAQQTFFSFFSRLPPLRQIEVDGDVLFVTSQFGATNSEPTYGYIAAIDYSSYHFSGFEPVRQIVPRQHWRIDHGGRALALSVKDRRLGLPTKRDGVTFGDLQGLNLAQTHGREARIAPRLRTTPGDAARAVDMSGSYAFFAPADTSNRTRIYDVNTDLRARSRTALDLSAIGAFTQTSLVATPELVVVSGVRGAIPEGKGTTGESRLFVGRYRTISDTLGRAPTVRIVAPTATALMKTGKAAVIRVAASDDIAVQEVTVSINGVAAYTDTLAPYEFSYTPAAGQTSVILGARARDFAGNATDAAALSVSIDP